MASLFRNIKNNLRQIIIAILFILAAASITFLLPREGRFRYEFKKGNPWPHENLTAPFVFSVYKTDAQLLAEQDSVLKDLNVFMNYDAENFISKLNEFKEHFDDSWARYSVRTFEIENREDYFEKAKYKKHRTSQEKYSTLMYELVREMYLSGIVEFFDFEEMQIGPFSNLIMVRGNIAQSIELESLYTIKEAYQNIDSELKKAIEEDNSTLLNEYSSFFENLGVDKYLVANVSYDAEATNREKEFKLSSISLTEGFIQQGELIISKGEIITQEKYQILESLRREFSQQKGNVNNAFIVSGKFLLVLLVQLMVYLFIYSFRREVFSDFKKTIFIIFMQVLMIAVAFIATHIGNVSIYIIPFTILPIIIRIFYDERLAFFIHVFTILMAALMAPNSFEFIFLNLIAGIAAIISMTNLYRRSRFFISSLVVMLSYSLVFFGLNVIQEGTYSQIDWNNFGYFAVNGILILISFLLIYVFEKAFGFLSDTTLMELSDTNQPLLRQLAENAPGTFQHSMQVGNLAEEAVIKIGGNPLLVRAGAYYHDIGKAIQPEYFTENQSDGFNPHNKLEYKKSASVIIDHIIKGVELAKKNNLPEPIINFIRTHQGNATVHYFYRLYTKENPEGVKEKEEFQYPGPTPQSKEEAVLMMADAVEAASRSLKEYTEESIDDLVESIVNVQMGENQFEEAAITFREIKDVKMVFKQKLKNIYHARIAYPKQ